MAAGANLSGKRSPDIEEIYRPTRHFYDFDYDLAMEKVKSHDSVVQRQQKMEQQQIAITTQVTTEVQLARPSTQDGNGLTVGGGGGGFNDGNSSSGRQSSYTETAESERQLVLK